jgi:hypothetical protein
MNMNTNPVIKKAKNAFLGAFTKLRKATISFVMSVCPYVCQYGTTRLLLEEFFMKFDIGEFFETVARKCKFH